MTSREAAAWLDPKATAAYIFFRHFKALSAAVQQDEA